MVLARSSRFSGSEMIGAMDEIGHVVRTLNGQRMLGETGSGVDDARHVERKFTLYIRAFRQNRNHTDAQMHQLGGTVP